MNVYAIFDASGLPQGFWSDDVYPPGTDGSVNPAIPAAALTITDAQRAEFLAHPGLRQWVNGAVQPYAPPLAPCTTPVRAAGLSALLDPLSPTQRATITADHKDRLQAEASEHPGGLLPIGNAKVTRAAADLGLTPDAWFNLAGY